MTDDNPKLLGRYEIQQELGRGMMGVVYRALDPDLGRHVALKTIKLAFAIPESEKEAFERRFLAEARAAAALSHPGLVVVHDVGRDAATGTVYIALEYLEGHTLSEVGADGSPMDWRQAVRITEKLAEALGHAHARGIVHRDVKPANIMLLGSGQPKVMDFGIAKLPASTLTTAGEFFGTPSFMSPEQAGGEAVDGRSDLFSLGCVLYQLLTGRRAFDGGTLPAILMRIMREDPEPPSQAVPGLPAALDALIAKALAKDKDQRYQTGQQMAEDAQDVLASRAPRHATASGDATAVSDATRVSERPWPVDVDTDEVPGPATSRLSHALAAAAGTSVLRETPREGPRRATVLLLAVVAAAALLTTGGLAVYVFLLHGSGTATGPSPAPTAASSTLAAMPTPNSLDGPEPDKPDAPSASPEAVPDPVPGKARVQLALEHSLGNGSVRVWVDDVVALDKPVYGRLTRKLFKFKAYKGSFTETLSVSPGPRTIRVEVTADSFSESKRIRGDFASGTTRRLRAEVTGWPRRELRLSWGS